MTRLLMTTDAVGGVWTYALELAGALGAHGVEVTPAVMGPPAREHQLRQLARAGITEVVEVPGALEWMEDPWSDVDVAGERLLELADRVGAEVVHLNGFVHAALPWNRPVVVVAHSDVMSWWHHVRGDEVPSSWDTYRRRVRAGLEAATAVVALTATGGADLRREYGVEPTHTIPNGRSDGWVRSRPKEPLVLGAGRLWDDAKNLRTLEVAAAELDWPVVLAGELPPERARHLDGAPDAGVRLGPAAEHGGVRLLGPVPFDDLATWMARAAVFAAPARYEPFGLGALEAALSGCALVLGDIGTAREVWGDRALFVHPDDPGSLHAVLQELCADPERCVRLGERARERARELSAMRMADAYAAVYRSLVPAVHR